jgi:putative glutathione S-transferase
MSMNLDYSNDGTFLRSDSAFRNWVTADGQSGPTGAAGFRAEPGRYHLYVSLACPWAHRTLLLRKFKNLEKLVSVSIVHWLMLERGWTFDEGPGVVPDPVLGAKTLREIYLASNPEYTGRITVPVLWDKSRRVIVNNESSEIIRMMNFAFDAVGASGHDFYPKHHRSEIDAVNGRIYQTLNNGVYKTGFATTQRAYEEAVGPLFGTLDWLDERLEERPWLVGSSMTEADIRLFTTLIRFDLVYATHFKCTVRRLIDYPTLWAYTRRIFQLPGVSETTNFEHIKRHYYESHRMINPYGIVPAGPAIDYWAP